MSNSSKGEDGPKTEKKASPQAINVPRMKIASRNRRSRRLRQKSIAGPVQKQMLAIAKFINNNFGMAGRYNLSHAIIPKKANEAAVTNAMIIGFL